MILKIMDEENQRDVRIDIHKYKNTINLIKSSRYVEFLTVLTVYSLIFFLFLFYHVYIYY